MLFYCFILFLSNIYAQFDFTQNIIIDETFAQQNPRKVMVADIDGDNYKDVVSLGNNILWYKNIDGLGNYGDAISIVDFSFNGAWFDMDIADIDGDNDVDIVFFNGVDNTPLVWVENLDGMGAFSLPQVIKSISSTNSYLNLQVKLVDMESDGDIDIVYSDIDGIGWYENTDGEGTFVNHLLISINHNNSDGPRDIELKISMGIILKM